MVMAFMVKYTCTIHIVTFNPFELNGPSNYFQLDEFISSFRVELYKVFLFKFLWNILAQITGP